MTREESEKCRRHNFLRSRGWYPWYNYEYWCHRDIPDVGDPTEYGLHSVCAVWYELLGKPKSKHHIFNTPMYILGKKGVVVTT